METPLTIVDYVRGYFPKATEDEAFNILMCCTPYPCGDRGHWDNMLKKYSELTDDADTAITLAHEDLDGEWDQLKLEGIV